MSLIHPQYIALEHTNLAADLTPDDCQPSQRTHWLANSNAI